MSASPPKVTSVRVATSGLVAPAGLVVTGDLSDAVHLARLAAIVDSSDDAILSKTLDGIITSWNAGAVRLFGYEPEEIIGKSIKTLIPAELHDEERHILARLRRGERIDHFETTRVRKDGHRLQLSITVSPIRDASGTIVGASKIARDIGPQRNAERTAAQLAAIVESSEDAIVSKNLDGRIQSWNAGAMRIFGYAAEEAVGQSITLIIPPEMYAEERHILDRVRRGERVEHFDTIRLTKDGRRIPVSVSVSPVCDPRGTIIGASKIARDISERKEADEALQESEQALREADRRKDEFMALLAHELRNPLAPIRYALATARKSDRTAEQQRRAEEIIERQVAHMSRLLDDLLDVSRITRGMLELKRADTELTVVLGTAIEAARPILDAKGHDLSLDLPKQAVRLVADSVRLAQVFSNLLINAAKYTDPGGHIELCAAQIDNEVIVSVRDNGMGISTDMMPRLFTMFAQDSTVVNHSEGGLGIGLALARGVVDLHGGRVEARSAGPGLGSEFIVTIPAGAGKSTDTDAQADEDPPVDGGGLKVLVVDDNRDAADTCSALLELSGHSVQTAYTGHEALAIAAKTRPHVVVTDIGLPDIDGYEVAANIKAAPWGRRTALVAVTGWGQESDKQRAFSAGFSHHLTKPIDPDTLESLLQSLSAELRAGG
ncbi:MAG: PAS domain S-box protein [Steroidobacteraceae bacterium]|jgi:PAS domain S-box-containing protein